jgi:type I restriction enzyme, S subunit
LKTSALENCTYPFAEVVEILDNRRKPINGKERQGRTGDIPYYGATGQVGWIDKSIFDEELVLLGEDGAPFLDGTKDKAYSVSGPSWVNNHAHVLRGKPTLLNRFLLHQLNSLDYRPYVNGTTRLKLAQGPMKQIPLLVPPLPTQHRIVAEIEEKLSCLDAAQSALLRAQANLKRYKASVIAQTCHAFDTELPAGWQWKTLPELGTLGRGKSKHRPRDDQRLYDGPYPFIQTGEVRHSNGRIKVYEKTYSEFGLAQSKLWPVGTLCITIAANIAETGILEFPSCFPDSVVGFCAEGQPLLVEYVELYIRSMKEVLERLAPATAQKNINLDLLSKVRVAVPSQADLPKVMAEAERRLSVIDRTEQTLRTQLERAKRLRQSILQQAFAP